MKFLVRLSVMSLATFAIAGQSLADDEIRGPRVSLPRADPAKSYDVEFATTPTFAEDSVILRKSGKSPLSLDLEPGLYHLRWREEGMTSKWLSKATYYRRHPAPAFIDLQKTYVTGPVDIRWQTIPGITWYLIELEGPGLKLRKYIKDQHYVLTTPTEGKYLVKVASALSEQLLKTTDSAIAADSEAKDDHFKVFVGTPSPETSFTVGAQAEGSGKNNRSQVALQLRAGRLDYGTLLGSSATNFSSNINGFDLNIGYASHDTRTYEFTYSSDSIILRGYLSHFERLRLVQKRLSPVDANSSYSLNWGYMMSSTFEYLARTSSDFITGEAKRHAVVVGGGYSRWLWPNLSVSAEAQLMMTALTQGGAVTVSKFGFAIGGYEAAVKARYLLGDPLAVSVGLHYLNDSYAYSDDTQSVSVKHTQSMATAGLVYLF